MGREIGVNFTMLNFEDMRSLMTQDQCQTAINEVIGQSRTLGWIVFGMAMLIILLALYCIMQQKTIAQGGKTWQKKQ